MTWRAGQSIHQVIVSAAPGDAATNAVLEIRSLLRLHGKSEAFACNIHPDLSGNVLPTSDYALHVPHEDRPLTLVHVSMGDDRFLPFIGTIPGDLVISYHNVTPSRYFAPWSPPMARLLEAGRRYLEVLRDRTVLALADSSFNAEDLYNVGYSRVRVGGLILSVERLLDVEPAPLPFRIEGPVVLSVGQLYPHKRPDLVVASFHELVTRHRPEAHLVLAGSSRLPEYAEALSHYVERLGLGPRVTITGHISEEELVAWYRRADVFVVASEHEGFCVPLVEAMEFGVPIVARANGAIPETLGDAGVIVPGDSGPRVLAGVVAAVIEDETAKEGLRVRARARAKAFTAEACRRQFLDALEDV